MLNNCDKLDRRSLIGKVKREASKDYITQSSLLNIIRLITDAGMSHLSEKIIQKVVRSTPNTTCLILQKITRCNFYHDSYKPKTYNLFYKSSMLIQILILWISILSAGKVLYSKASAYSNPIIHIS